VTRVLRRLWAARRVILWLFLIICLGLLGLKVWRWVDDIVPALYVVIASIYFLCPTFRVPNRSWWEGGRVASISSEWGKKRLGVGVTANQRISRLSNLLAVRSYMASLIYADQTNQLCVQFRENVPIRAGVALGMSFFVAFSDKVGARPAPTEWVPWGLRVLSLLIPFLVQMTWDCSRFMRQTSLNLSVAEP
jgi:hypothetical protein